MISNEQGISLKRGDIVRVREKDYCQPVFVLYVRQDGDFDGLLQNVNGGFKIPCVRACNDYEIIDRATPSQIEDALPEILEIAKREFHAACRKRSDTWAILSSYKKYDDVVKQYNEDVERCNIAYNSMLQVEQEIMKADLR